jgi:hypothetical protein
VRRLVYKPIELQAATMKITDDTRSGCEDAKDLHQLPAGR